MAVPDSDQATPGLVVIDLPRTKDKPSLRRHQQYSHDEGTLKGSLALVVIDTPHLKVVVMRHNDHGVWVYPGEQHLFGNCR